MNYFLTIAYKGTNYQGWQRQKNGLGIQQVIEDTLSKILRQPCVLMGCGRTDAGVHARNFVAHLRLQKEAIPNLTYKLNRLLPNDIAIKSIHPVPSNAHAQTDAISRRYHYYIHCRPDPFIRELSAYYSLDCKNGIALQNCVAAIKGVNDFRSFCKQPDKVPHTRCKVNHCAWHFIDNNNKMRFEISADRFLRGMVRLLVGNLLEVLEGRLSEKKFIEALQSQKPLPYFKMAYPQGLYLEQVTYSQFIC